MNKMADAVWRCPRCSGPLKPRLMIDAVWCEACRMGFTATALATDWFATSRELSLETTTSK